mmetsp:Transcript_10491/g.18982  ORF Transcript_10491/g.18982 Transcript_10491/m.18982 type:complete len:187 (-) Transcript_10491:30-590(-)
MGNRVDCCVACNNSADTTVEKAAGTADGSKGSKLVGHQRSSPVRVLEEAEIGREDTANVAANVEEDFGTIAPLDGVGKPEEEFWVSVRRDGQKMGLSVALNPGLGYLRVGMVKADGVFAKWNEDHSVEAEKQITAHCFIKEVNGRSAVHDMVSELRTANELSMLVVKLPPAKAEAAGGTLTAGPAT